MKAIVAIFGLLGLTMVLSACPPAGGGCKQDADCPNGRYCDSYSSECLYDCTFDADCRGDDRFCSDRGRCEIGCTQTNGGVEACDGLDNDCDGSTDEELGSSACAEENAHGRCEGQESCVGGQLVCDAAVPAEEACDGEDNDCDGQTDEDLAGVHDCPLSQGVCAGSVRQCGGTSGWTECDYGADYQAGVEGFCDGLDNDCDGESDEELGPLPCPKTQGVCAGVGQLCLGASGWGECSYGADYEDGSETRCDGLDNDCDGATDEDLQVDWSNCETGPQAADSIDNNCDGQTDEPGGCMVQLPGRQAWIDIYEATIFSDPYCSQQRYGAASDDYPPHFYDTDNQPSLDILYACALPGIRPSRYLTVYQARRACVAQGKRLCTAEEWTLACGGPGDPPWEFAYGDSFEAGRCNDFTNVAADSTPAGQFDTCVSPLGAYDMSGNLFEWVDDICSWNSAKTAVHGGSFSCQVGSSPPVDCDVTNPAHASEIESRYHCQHDWHSEWCADTDSAGSNQGFRCCWDGP